MRAAGLSDLGIRPATPPIAAGYPVCAAWTISALPCPM